jgi:hypothetical protein
MGVERWRESVYEDDGVVAVGLGEDEVDALGAVDDGFAGDADFR